MDFMDVINLLIPLIGFGGMFVILICYCGAMWHHEHNRKHQSKLAVKSDWEPAYLIVVDDGR